MPRRVLIDFNVSALGVFVFKVPRPDAQAADLLRETAAAARQTWESAYRQAEADFTAGPEARAVGRLQGLVRDSEAAEREALDRFGAIEAEVREAWADGADGKALLPRRDRAAGE